MKEPSTTDASGFPGIRPGLTAERDFTVTERMVTTHVGGAGGVLSTPRMIAMIEDTAQRITAPLLSPGHTTVGFEVCVRHLAPTPVGMRVTIRAELTHVDGRKLLFRVEAHNERRKIGDGTHRRTIIRLGALDQPARMGDASGGGGAGGVKG